MGRRSPAPCSKGFTLIEIVLAIAIMAILAAVIVPAAFSLLKSQRTMSTKDQLTAIKQAIVGNSSLTAGSNRASFGYLGDMGSLPSSLDNLVVRGTQPAFSPGSAPGQNAGWNGSYLAPGFAADSYKIDLFNNPLTYTTTTKTNSNGAVVIATITSAGPDRTLNTADDLSVDILQNEAFSTVSGYVKSSTGAPLANIPVSIYYPQNGASQSTFDLTDSNGFYTTSAAQIPFGIRSVQIIPGTGTTELTVSNALAKSNGTWVKFTINNNTSNDISITSITLYWPTSNYYDTFKINGAAVFQRKASGQCRGYNGMPVTFTPVVVGGSGQAPSQTTSVQVAAATTLVPDIIYAPIQAGGTAAVEIDNWWDDICAGHSVNMIGIPFTVTFSDGTTVNFTPAAG